MMINDSIKVEKNPWEVKSIYEYYFFNCPTCIYKNSIKQDFFDHILQFHPQSSDHLRKISDGSLSDIITPWANEEIILSDHNFIGTKKFNNSIEKVEDAENVDVKYEPFEENNYQDNNEYLNSTVDFNDEHYSTNETMKIEKVEAEQEYNCEIFTEDFPNFQEKHTSDVDMTKNCSAIVKLTKIDDVINELKNTTTVSISCTSTKEIETENDSIEYSEDAQELLDLKVHKAEKKQQKCEICGKSFTTLKAIGKHKLRMHGVKKPREKQGPYKIAERKDPNRLIPCEICGRSFRWRYLKNHKEVVHEKIKKKYSEWNDPNRLVQCEICGKSLKRKCLKNHKEVVHEKIKKNERKRSGICDQCGKFVNNLYCHKLYLHHTEDNPLTCKTCGKTVNNKHVLQKHEKACVKIPCKYINKILFRNKRLAFLKRFAETFHLIQTSYI